MAQGFLNCMDLIGRAVYITYMYLESSLQLWVIQEQTVCKQKLAWPITIVCDTFCVTHCGSGTKAMTKTRKTTAQPLTKHYYKPAINTRQRNHNFKHSITKQLLQVDSNSTLNVSSNVVSSSSLSSDPWPLLDKGYVCCHPAPCSGAPLSAGGRVNGLTPINPIEVVNPPQQFW